jgi:hypothetical protein
MGTVMRHLSLAPVAALLLAAVAAAPVAANEPVAGHDDRYPHPTNAPPITLGFHFGSAVPAWVQTSVTNAWQNGWDDPAGNTSRIPRLDAGGGGTVYYQDRNGSPCTGDTGWIGCNPDTPGDRTGFAIYLRLLPSDSQPTWLWQQRDGTCRDVRDDGYATGVCFSITRVATHEMEHNTLTRSHEDQGGLASIDTVMGAVTPTQNGAPTTWNVDTFLRCDDAGALLEYGISDRALKYPACFATTPGEGVKGLNTTLSVASSSYTACANGSNVTVAGRLALENDWKHYRYLANTPLESRVISIYRKASGASAFPSTPYTTATATDVNAGNNWSKAFSSTTAIAYDYKAVWTTSSGEPALNSSNAVLWTIRWSTGGCPLFATK